MAEVVTALPAAESVSSVTFLDLVAALPNEIKFPFNVWIGGKLARYGKTSETVVFLLEVDREPTSEEMNFFDSLIQPFGLSGTASEQWRNEFIPAVRIYNEGRLIVDKVTGRINELPAAVRLKDEITPEIFFPKLPAEIPFKETIWLTGGIAKNGYSMKDIDLIIGEPPFSVVVPSERISEIRKFFYSIVGVRVDVGYKLMTDREPISLLKLYEGGLLCQP